MKSLAREHYDLNEATSLRRNLSLKIEGVISLRMRRIFIEDMYPSDEVYSFLQREVQIQHEINKI